MVVIVEVKRLSFKASTTIASSSDCNTISRGLLRKRDATGRAINPMVKSMRRASPAFNALFFQA
jgi:hypothetical protein